MRIGAGIVRRSILREVSLLSLPFYALDPLGSVADDIIDSGTEAFKNATVKSITKAKLRRRRYLQHYGPKKFNDALESAVVRASLKEGKYYYQHPDEYYNERNYSRPDIRRFSTHKAPEFEASKKDAASVTSKPVRASTSTTVRASVPKEERKRRQAWASQVDRAEEKVKPIFGKKRKRSKRHEELRAKFKGKVGMLPDEYAVADKDVYKAHKMYRKTLGLAPKEKGGARTGMRWLSKQEGKVKVSSPSIPAKVPNVKIGKFWLGAGLANAGINAVSSAFKMANENASELSRIRMGESAATRIASRLMENYKTWATRRKLYGPSGRRGKNWRYDFTNPNHTGHALTMTDPQFKKFSGSTADLDKRVGVATKSDVPLKYTYFSNDKKNLYSGKTIGMRQKLISEHKKLRVKLPSGFENKHYSDINDMFKRYQRYGWYKRTYNKLPWHQKARVRVGDAWRSIKRIISGLQTKESTSSTIEETCTLEECKLRETATPSTCTFLTGQVRTPMQCGCADCEIITNKMLGAENEARERAIIADKETGEEEKSTMKETSVTSFGQSLRSDTDVTRMNSFIKKYRQLRKKLNRRQHNKDLLLLAKPGPKGLNLLKFLRNMQ